MSKKLLFFFLFCFSSFTMLPFQFAHASTSEDSSVFPFLLPFDHPAKTVLDRIFSRARVTDSLEAIEEAGFEIISVQKRSFVIVARHPLAPGYVFKMHLDSEEEGRNGMDSTQWLINRCVTAKKIRKIIEKKGFKHFAVPDKWLYILPSHPAPMKLFPKPIILVATDMNIKGREETLEAWKTVVTKEHLKELHSILSEGCGSATLETNVPYIGNGRFAFIDTEKQVRSKRLERVKLYLSPEMQKYWEHLTD